MPARDRQFLFVMGCPRSGTTALARLLNAHPQVAIGMERFGEHRKALTPDLYEPARFRDLRPGDAPYDRFDGWPLSNEVLGRYSDATYVGDEIPLLYLDVDGVLERFPDPMFVMIFRNPYSVAASYEWRRQEADAGRDERWPDDFDHERAVAHWNRALRAYEQLLDRAPVTRVLNETLFSADDEVARDAASALFDGVGLDLDPAVVDRLRELRKEERHDTPRLTEDQAFHIAQRANTTAYRRVIESGGFVPGYETNPRYRELRKAFVDHCVAVGGLSSTDRVLDVGCGIGGVAEHLTEILDEGSYHGVDVDDRAVDRARREIGRHHDRFDFAVIDVWSGKYNPTTDAPRAVDFRFPFEDDSFDFAILRSVFTHLEAPEIAHYLDELARALAPGGAVAMTFFLLGETRPGRGHDDAEIRVGFPHDRGSHRLRDADRPEVAVAVDEAWLRSTAAAVGLNVENVAYGGWDGRAHDVPGQDIVVCRRTG